MRHNSIVNRLSNPCFTKMSIAPLDDAFSSWGDDDFLPAAPSSSDAPAVTNNMSDLEDWLNNPTAPPVGGKNSAQKATAAATTQLASLKNTSHDTSTAAARTITGAPGPQKILNNKRAAPGTGSGSGEGEAGAGSLDKKSSASSSDGWGAFADDFADDDAFVPAVNIKPSGAGGQRPGGQKKIIPKLKPIVTQDLFALAAATPDRSYDKFSAPKLCLSISCASTTTTTQHASARARLWYNCLFAPVPSYGVYLLATCSGGYG